MSFAPEQGQLLAPLTTLELGGPAKHFVRVDKRDVLWDALRWAEREQARVGVLGGGSNLVVSDAGFDGLVVQMDTRGIELVPTAEGVELTAQAGEAWQVVVDAALAAGLAGLECLTGIPGSAGATPIQNVGAYGQEVSETIRAVEVLDRRALQTSWLSHAECGFAYRTSRFKREPERFVVLAVRYRLKPGGAPSLRYPELQRALSLRGGAPSLRDVAETVRELREAKGMLCGSHGENRRSAGSFFMNPIVPNELAARVKAQAVARGWVDAESKVPCFDAGGGQSKLAAAWLIERAGIQKGMRRGAVGISSQHALALVHHGGGSTAELLELAEHVKAQVRGVFGLDLELEPVRW